MKKLFITHAGIFHADDVLCAAMARLVYHNIEIRRVYNVPDDLDSGNTIVADIGGGKYDHHQNAPLRSDGIPHCAASLLWKDGYGEKIVSMLHPTLNGQQVEGIVASVDAMLLRSIAAIDNGCKLEKGNYGTLGTADVFSLSSIVSQFNPNWNSAESADEAFEEAALFVTGILKRLISRSASAAEGENIVKAAVEQATLDETPEIVVLPQFVPWQSYICHYAPEALVMVFPSLRGGWNIQLVPTTVNSRETRITIPESWCGLSGQEAGRMAEGMTFCHKAGFLAAFSSKDAALRAAKRLV